MSLRVQHRGGSVRAGIAADYSSRRRHRRCCSLCRTFIAFTAIRCRYCGQRSLTHWHVLFLGGAVLAGFVLLLRSGIEQISEVVAA
jgi:hypothetical protein